MSAVLVTGGTGQLGRAVVERLLDAGHEVRVASRGLRPERGMPYTWSTVDYRMGAGMGVALDGIDTIVHCANGTDDEPLLTAAKGAGSPHLLYISIVGVDRVPLGYYRAKLAAEQAIERSGLPYTILRATQFHDLVRVVLAGLARPPAAMPVPDLRFQPIDVAVVATRLAELATGAALGRAPDLGGPEIRPLPELARTYLAATHRRRRVLPVRLPGAVFRGYRDGGHLAPANATPGPRFADHLAAHPDPAALRYHPSR